MQRHFRNRKYNVFGHVCLLILLSMISTTKPVYASKASVLGGPMKVGLLYVGATDRLNFVTHCMRPGAPCYPQDNELNSEEFQWARKLDDTDKRRFWEIYKCSTTDNPDECPEDGGWSKWSGWSACSRTCGLGGQQLRNRSCTAPTPKRHGLNCTGPSIDKEPCNMGSCMESDISENPIYDSALKASQLVLVKVYLSHPELKAKCNSGTCTYEEVKPLLGPTLTDSYWDALMCLKYGQSCPVDGGWTTWNEWAACSQLCSNQNGHRTRTRQCANPRPGVTGDFCEGASYEFVNCVGREDCSKVAGLNAGSAWSEWSACSASCGGGERVRDGGGCKPGFTEQQCKQYGTQRDPCNVKPCEADGAWAVWGKWSSCVGVCGSWGGRMRHRTCTDPAPTRNGKHCPGQGSEVSRCFVAPCPDYTQLGAFFDGKAHIDYSPVGLPARVLFMFLRFRCDSPDGVIFHRYYPDCDPSDSNEDYACVSYVLLHVERWSLALSVKLGDATAEVTATTRIGPFRWQEVEVKVLDKKITLTLNNTDSTASFSEQPPAVDLDQHMRLGKSSGQEGFPKQGFYGEMSELRVNYRQYTFGKSVGWTGAGSPEKITGASVIPLDVPSLYPVMNGHQYFTLPVEAGASELHISMVLQFQTTADCLLLYLAGQTPDSYILVYKRGHLLRVCASAGNGQTCPPGQELGPGRWYIVEVSATQALVKLQLDGRASGDVMLSGPYFKSSQTAYIGGLPKHMWPIATGIAAVKDGLPGYMHSVKVNAQPVFRMMRGTLLGTDGTVNDYGVSVADRFSEILTDPDDVVFLQCGFPSSLLAGTTGDVMWLHGNKILEESEAVKIEQSPEVKRGSKFKLELLANSKKSVVLSRLRLEAGEPESEGFFVCMFYHDGLVRIPHAFAVSRQPAEQIENVSTVKLLPTRQKRSAEQKHSNRESNRNDNRDNANSKERKAPEKPSRQNPQNPTERKAPEKPSRHNPQNPTERTAPEKPSRQNPQNPSSFSAKLQPYLTKMKIPLNMSSISDKIKVSNSKIQHEFNKLKNKVSNFKFKHEFSKLKNKFSKFHNSYNFSTIKGKLASFQLPYNFSTIKNKLSSIQLPFNVSTIKEKVANLQIGSKLKKGWAKFNKFQKANIPQITGFLSGIFGRKVAKKRRGRIHLDEMDGEIERQEQEWKKVKRRRQPPKSKEIFKAFVARLKADKIAISAVVVVLGVVGFVLYCQKRKVAGKNPPQPGPGQPGHPGYPGQGMNNSNNIPQAFLKERNNSNNIQQAFRKERNNSNNIPQAFRKERNNSNNISQAFLEERNNSNNIPQAFRKERNNSNNISKAFLEERNNSNNIPQAYHSKIRSKERSRAGYEPLPSSPQTRPAEDYNMWSAIRSCDNVLHERLSDLPESLNEEMDDPPPYQRY